MNQTRLIILFTIAILAGLVSCNDDIQEPEYRISSIQEIAVEAESSAVDIQMQESDWIIEGVYSLNGQTITDGVKPLQLAGLGTLEAHWFKITHDQPSSLKLEIFENYQENQRGIVIKIKKGAHSEEIKIIQATSQGYQFKEIKYSLQEKTTFNRNSSSPKLTYHNYTEEENSVGIYPYGNEKDISTFKSEDQGAFNWISDERIEVDVPTPSIEKHYYQRATTQHPSQLKDFTFNVAAPPLKQLSVTVDIEYLKQVYDYTLILVNKRTQQEKEIKGEWILEQPISYQETVELSELPKQ